MVWINIDGKDYKGEKGMTLLELARKEGLDIPTLCYHPALEPYGSCRLCLVEITKGGQGRLVSSCTYPIREEGLEVNTCSPRIQGIRGMVMELTLARCPGVKEIQELAEKLGVRERRLAHHGEEDCILCGLCVRVCREIIGKEALGFVHRGAEREVATPFFARNPDCVGCTACAFVCPTGAIKVAEEGARRLISPWQSDIPLARCLDCGIPFSPEDTAGYLLGKLGLPAGWLKLCPACRRKAVARELSQQGVPTGKKGTVVVK